LDGDGFILQVHGVFTRICSGATLVACSGGACWLALYGMAAAATMEGHSNRSTPVAANVGNGKTLRVSASIYNLTDGAATTGWISISG
jgi:hypothetical protein